MTYWINYDYMNEFFRSKKYRSPYFYEVRLLFNDLTVVYNIVNLKITLHSDWSNAHPLAACKSILVDRLKRKVTCPYNKIFTSPFRHLGQQDIGGASCKIIAICVYRNNELIYESPYNQYLNTYPTERVVVDASKQETWFS